MKPGNRPFGVRCQFLQPIRLTDEGNMLYPRRVGGVFSFPPGVRLCDRFRRFAAQRRNIHGNQVLYVRIRHRGPPR